MCDQRFFTGLSTALQRRALHQISLAFLFAARCYASAAYAVMRCLFICVSVCPSLTFVNSVETNRDIFKKFSLPGRSGSHTILVFCAPDVITRKQYSDWHPQQRGSNEGRIGYNLDRQRTSGFVIGNCCTMVSLSQLAAEFLLTAGIGLPSATHYKQSQQSLLFELQACTGQTNKKQCIMQRPTAISAQS